MHVAAVDSYCQALDIFDETGQRYQRAETLSHLGDAYQTVGELEAAHTAWREALAILDELQHPDAAGVRTQIEAAEAALSAASRDSRTEAR